MKDYQGPLEIVLRYHANNHDFGYMRLDVIQGRGFIRLPINSAMGIQDHEIVVTRVELPESEADVYLEKTLRLIEQERQLSRLERDVDEMRRRLADAERIADEERNRQHTELRSVLDIATPEELVEAISRRDVSASWVIAQLERIEEVGRDSRLD